MGQQVGAERWCSRQINWAFPCIVPLALSGGEEDKCADECGSTSLLSGPSEAIMQLLSKGADGGDCLVLFPFLFFF